MNTPNTHLTANTDEEVSSDMIQIRVTVEARHSEEIVEFDPAEWRDMTPAERREMCNEAVDVAIGNAGGAGYTFIDPAYEADTVDAPGTVLPPTLVAAAVVEPNAHHGAGGQLWWHRGCPDSGVMAHPDVPPSCTWCGDPGPLVRLWAEAARPTLDGGRR